MIPFPVIVLVLLSIRVFAQIPNSVQNCNCGFLDAYTNDLFTDSIIVYFNETSGLPVDFVAENYIEKSKKDWNAVYREGADPSNLRLSNGNSLELLVQPSTDDHVVSGAGIRTLRQDIQHGSFRTLMKSPSREFSGSAISMMWKYNETEVTELSIMNTDDESEAWVGTFVNDEFTERKLGINYTQLLHETTSNQNYTTLGGGLSNGSVDAWDFTEYRIDWTPDHIAFYMGGNLTRQVLHKENKGMPSVPSAFFFKHWSSGNRYSMEGPPRKTSAASIGWIRMFFNSSSTTEEAREDFVTRCPKIAACSINDITLRGSSQYAHDVATRKWVQTQVKNGRRMVALWVSLSCLGFTSFLLFHTFILRITARIRRISSKVNTPASGASSISDNDEKKSSEHDIGSRADATGNSSNYGSSVYSERTHPEDDMSISHIEPRYGTSSAGGSTPRFKLTPHSSQQFDSRAATPLNSHFNTTREDLPRSLREKDSQTTLTAPPLPDRVSHLTLSVPTIHERESQSTLVVPPMSPDRESQRTLTGPTFSNRPFGSLHAPVLPHANRTSDKIAMAIVTEPALPGPRLHAHPPPTRHRIDHLAGLTAVCSLVVTVMHFCLTFAPAAVIPGAPQHNQSEYWAQKVIAPFLLNQMWLGVFFTTSARFLVAPYLRGGKLKDIAKASVRRTPRLMIPVATIALLEYFCIDVGATQYLESTPSLTWSTWPYVTRYQHFGQYLSEILELMFLVPNAVPQITLHYCTGVLWTIAVQLQGSWLVLTGVIVVREIKTPWKRMCFYVFCMANHWYALSWGTYLWLGLLLTDLDVTYKWKAYLYKRPAAYYPLITLCWLCVAAGFAVNVLPNWLKSTWNFATQEHDVHPDVYTGEMMRDTDAAGYPPYYTPRLNGLLFAGGMQAVVELSTVVQWFLSTPPFLILFPHVFTIYLLHGLVFWTWGSWLLVFLANRGFTYGVNVAVVGITSYALLFLCLPIVTPVLEALGKDVTALIWMTADEKSPPRRRTLFPFPEDIFTGREINGKGKTVDVETGSARCSLVQGMVKERAKDKGPRVEVQSMSHEDQVKAVKSLMSKKKGKGKDVIAEIYALSSKEEVKIKEVEVHTLPPEKEVSEKGQDATIEVHALSSQDEAMEARSDGQEPFPEFDPEEDGKETDVEIEVHVLSPEEEVEEVQADGHIPPPDDQVNVAEVGSHALSPASETEITEVVAHNLSPEDDTEATKIEVHCSSLEDDTQDAHVEVHALSPVDEAEDEAQEAQSDMHALSPKDEVAAVRKPV